MSTEKISLWHNVIKAYIDDLKEEDKKSEYIDELLSSSYKNSLMKAKTDKKEDKKALSKLLVKVKKLAPTYRNRSNFEAYYKICRNNKWVEDIDEIQFIEKKTNFYNIWICHSLMLSDGVFPGTHIAKLTHSSSTGSSFLDRSSSTKSGYLTTSSLIDEIIDGTYPNARLSKQVKFLMLEHDGNSLFDEIKNNNSSVFSGFEDYPEESKLWVNQYRKILNKKPSSDFLLKQVYFPVESNYHLLTVVRSSSLAQKIYTDYFSKEARKLSNAVNKTRRSEKYSPEISKQALGVCKIAPTQSQPQNVSVMLGKMGGQIRLFSAQPPVWKSQKKPPIYRNSWFYENKIYHTTKEDINFLREFLMRFDYLNLSIRDPKREAWIIKWVNRIISNILFFAEDTQNLTPGWSGTPGIRLKLEQQYFLDPYRSDDIFQAARKNSNWQTVVCADFAAWLNSKLIGKDKKFTPQKEHTKLWKSLMEQALRDSNQVIEATLAVQNGEDV